MKKVDCVVVGPIQCNCYIVSDSVTKKAYLIDPGAESPELLSFLQTRKYDLEAVLVTHAHIDHVGGIEMVHSNFPVPILYHSGDDFLYRNLSMQAKLFGVTPKDLQATQPLVGEGRLKDGEEFSFGDERLQVIQTPGHTPGSVCFLASGEDSILFTGDTLFEGSIGRTDLWGGSFEQIIQSIQGRLMQLGDDVQVFPGHGSSTTVGHERCHNPFLISK